MSSLLELAVDDAATQVCEAAQQVVNQTTNHHNIVFTVSYEVMQSLMDALKVWQEATEDFLVTQTEVADKTTKEL